MMRTRILTLLLLLICSSVFAQDLKINVPSPNAHKKIFISKKNRQNAIPLIPSPPKKEFIKKRKKLKRKRFTRKNSSGLIVHRSFGMALQEIQKNSNSKTLTKTKFPFKRSKKYTFKNDCKLIYKHHLQDFKRPYLLFSSNCIGDSKIRINQKDLSLSPVIISSKKTLYFDANLVLDDLKINHNSIYWRWKNPRLNFSNLFLNELYLARKSKNWLKLIMPPKSAKLFEVLIKRFYIESNRANLAKKKILLDQFHEIVPTRTRILFSQSCPLVYHGMQKDEMRHVVKVEFSIPCMPKNIKYIVLDLPTDSDSLPALSLLKKEEKFLAQLEFHSIIEIADKFYIHWDTILKK